LDVNSTTRAAGLTSAQERTGISGNVDNSRNPELVETPSEGMVTTPGMPARAGIQTNIRGQNKTWDPKITNAAITSPTAGSTVIAEATGASGSASSAGTLATTQIQQ
jgi:hypothetical protein